MMHRLVLLLLVLLLGACGGEEHQDIKQWMKDESGNLRGRVPPLPEIRPFPVVSYDGGSLMDPFKAAKLEPERPSAKAQGGGIKPDLDRRKEPLEAYPLESLHMVGTLERNGVITAIVLAGRIVHQIRAGNHLGQNFGVVTLVTPSTIQIKELVQDATGDWVERTNVLQMQEQETRK
jgi:type IV pilus assembly protein PilP